MVGKARKKASKYSGKTGVHRNLKIEYDSGLERKFLDQCYFQGIKVQRCKVKVPYQDSTGKWRLYEPDFYLPDFDLVVEIKGLWAIRSNHAFVREKFQAARAKFKGRYTVLSETELKSDYVAKLHKGLVNGN